MTERLEKKKLTFKIPLVGFFASQLVLNFLREIEFNEDQKDRNQVDNFLLALFWNRKH